jgi:AcrR family transcriptional regulator
MSMSISYEQRGRTSQKERTRNALLAAAGELLSRGVAPSVERAAEAADVSRATAYRYFPNQRSLLVAAHPEIEARSLLGDDAPEDVEGRLEEAVGEIIRITIDTEPQLRAMLRVSLEPNASDRDEPILRRGRAIGWLEDALSPLPKRLRRRLAIAIRASCGIEALVWLTDVAGLSHDEAAELMRWSALALLRAARDDG